MKKVFLLAVILACLSIAYYYLYTLPQIKKSSISKIAKIVDKIPPKEDLELQSMCSQKANVFFNNYDATLDNAYKSYENHYNRKLGHCFVLIKVSGHNENGHFYEYHLMDVYENVEQGVVRFCIIKEKWGFDDCYVFDKRCKDQYEFNDFVKSYMEE